MSMDDKWVSNSEENDSPSKDAVSFSIKDDKVGTIATWEDEDTEWEYYMPTNDVSCCIRLKFYLILTKFQL